MFTALDAVYESGAFRPLQPMPIALPEHTRVRLVVETMVTAEPAEWLAQAERSLRSVWENESDDVFDDLLAQ